MPAGDRFDIPVPKRAPLEKQQGLLVNPERGIILIKADDPETRQRFTEAHELMELLFSALPSGKGWAARQLGSFRPTAKENLCDAGAAELLMPRDSFALRVRRRGTSFQTADELRVEYGVSLTAALIHMAQLAPRRHAVILWRMKNKPSELKSYSPENQLTLFGGSAKSLPPPKLRVEWTWRGQGVVFIPREKSAPNDCSIYTAWHTGTFGIGHDMLDLGTINGVCQCESWPFDQDGERVVLSLLHLPGDTGCGL